MRIDEASYRQALHRAYQGEVMGEAWFTEAARRVGPMTRKAKLRTLAELEALTADILRPAARRLQFAHIGNATARRAGLRLARLRSRWRWSRFVVDLEKMAAVYAQRYVALATRAVDADRTALQWLAEHELALEEFARRESSGAAGDSLDRVRRFMRNAGGRARSRAVRAHCRWRQRRKIAILLATGADSNYPWRSERCNSDTGMPP
jgi:hypothetical protein